MHKLNQLGSSSWLLSLGLVVFLIIALVFGGWAFKGRQDYKNNVDAKIAAAVTVAKQQEGTAKDAQFAEAQKSPLRTYNGPQAYGSLVVMFPKTWSGYVDDSGSNNTALVDGYFANSTVPSITDTNSIFALRVQVIAQSYSQTVQAINQSLTGPQVAATTVTAYSLPKVPSQVGVKVSGQISDSKTGTMVVLPLRDKTLQVWTEGSQYLNDFNTYILPNLSYSP